MTFEEALMLRAQDVTPENEIARALIMESAQLALVGLGFTTASAYQVIQQNAQQLRTLRKQLTEEQALHLEAVATIVRFTR